MLLRNSELWLGSSGLLLGSIGNVRTDKTSTLNAMSVTLDKSVCQMLNRCKHVQSGLLLVPVNTADCRRGHRGLKTLFVVLIITSNTHYEIMD